MQPRKPRPCERRTLSELDDILQQWHHWQGSYTPVRGYNARALVCGDYRTSRQYDDANGALDDALHDERMRTVSFEVAELPDMMRYSIADDARALCLGAALRHNPRLPDDRTQREAIRITARSALTVRLTKRGIMVAMIASMV